MKFGEKGEMLDFGVFKNWNMKWIISRQLPDSPPPQQGASGPISGLTWLCLYLFYPHTFPSHCKSKSFPPNLTVLPLNLINSQIFNSLEGTVKYRKWSRDPKWSPKWTANDPRLQVIPKVDRKWSREKLREWTGSYGTDYKERTDYKKEPFSLAFWRKMHRGRQMSGPFVQGENKME